jgi:hypothetical protein
MNYGIRLKKETGLRYSHRAHLRLRFETAKLHRRISLFILLNFSRACEIGAGGLSMPIK